MRLTRNLEKLNDKGQILTLKKDMSMLLWTDQICINQQRHEEKSHQVGFMRYIYLRAAYVVVGLSNAGNDTNNDASHNTPDYTGEILGILKLHREAIRNVEQRKKAQYAHENRDRLGPLCLETCDYLCKAWKVLFDEYSQSQGSLCIQDEWLESLLVVIPRLLSAPWWQRAWVSRITTRKLVS
jgi:hypothetical protein